MPSGSNSDDYAPPTPSDLTMWGEVVTRMLNAEHHDADSVAALLGYHLTAFTDTTGQVSHLFYILEENGGNGKHWGTFVLNSQPVRSNLVIQSPHPLHDMNTGSQGALIFKEVGALMFMISGAHRCNHTAYSSCSGTTTACGASEPYRVSDQPHVVDGTFQKTTEVLENTLAGLFFIQVHGFAKTTGDPDLIMSNGTITTPAVNKLVDLKSALLAEDSTLTFKIPHIDTGWTRLIATTNTQGRLINGSPYPCTQPATTSTGRFIHIEQAFPKLRDSQQNWLKLLNAIAATFSVTTSVHAEFISPPVASGFHLGQNYPNPFNPSTHVPYTLDRPGEVSLQVFDVLGRRVATLVSGVREAGSYVAEFDASLLPGGIYYVTLRVHGMTQTRPMTLVR